MNGVLERFPVHVIVERRPAASRWLDAVWRPVAVLPGRLEAPPWHVLAETGGMTRYFAGNTDLQVHPGETQHLKDNLSAEEPRIFVVLRPAGPPVGWSLLAATAEPGEAHAHADCGEDLVEAVPMAPPIALWLARFVGRHHVERPLLKRQRDRTEKAPPHRRGMAP